MVWIVRANTRCLGFSGLRWFQTVPLSFSSFRDTLASRKHYVVDPFRALLLGTPLGGYIKREWVEETREKDTDTDTDTDDRKKTSELFVRVYII
jgi:hypothetical protein